MALTAKQEAHARNVAVKAARLCLHNAQAIHYTEGPARWQGIAQHKNPLKGQFPTECDCSAFVTWCLWAGLEGHGTGDIVNGEQWKAGYTGTMLRHGREVPIKQARRGDAIIYGAKGSTGAHTALVVTPGPDPLVVSQGSEAAPFLLKWNYRPDVMCARRYIPDHATVAKAAHKKAAAHKQPKPAERKPAAVKKPAETHAASKRGPLVMYDDTNLALIPANAPAVAGYVGGKWPTFGQLAAKFPHARHLSIAINAAESARCLDIEQGDATISEAAGWLRHRADRSKGKPVLYTSAGNAAALLAAMQHAGIKRSEWLLWTAHYNYREHICGPNCGYPVGADATQWTDKAMGRSLDQTLCGPDFWS